MPDLIFIADRNLIENQTFDASPAQGLPSLPCNDIFQEARAQLYALVTGGFLDDAMALEILLHTDTDQLVYALESDLVVSIGNVEEDDTDELIIQWRQTAEVENLDADPVGFLFSLIHLCQIVANDPDLGVYVLSEG